MIPLYKSHDRMLRSQNSIIYDHIPSLAQGLPSAHYNIHAAGREKRLILIPIIDSACAYILVYTASESATSYIWRSPGYRALRKNERRPPRE